MRGGAGNDRLLGDAQGFSGAAPGDTLWGDEGNDFLDGGAGPDVLNGEAGDDVLAAATNILGPNDKDRLNGGADTDTVDYSARGAAVVADLDGVADDGMPGEDDAIGADVENIIGSSEADRLTGNGGSNLLDGGPGDDFLDGGRGADVLRGGDGRDLVTYADRTTGVKVDLRPGLAGP